MQAYSLRKLIKPFSTINSKEMEQFNKIKSWWSPSSQMNVLYQYNYQRIQFLRDLIQKENNHHFNFLKPVQGWKIIDVGCGAGFLTQSLSRLGGNVVGLDPNQTSFVEALNHKNNQPTLNTLAYYNCSIQQYLQKFKNEKGQQDLVTSMDVIEHVDNPQQFVSYLAQSLKPGGLMLLSTISKTVQSFLTHIVVAQYLTGLVPRGTHNYSKFITPEALIEMLRNEQIQVAEIRQLQYNWKGQFQKKKGGANYMVIGRKKIRTLQQDHTKNQLTD